MCVNKLSDFSNHFIPSLKKFKSMVFRLGGMRTIVRIADICYPGVASHYSFWDRLLIL